MPITIETPEGPDALAEFGAFHDRAYAGRAARWGESPLHQPILAGESPFARDRRIRPFVARDGGEVVARAAAVIDPRYQRHWNERLGHVVWFEALPDAREASRRLLDAASAWLAEQGAEAARTGFGLMDFPFTIDAYEALPPSMLRQNPAAYHTLVKQAGFEVEQGFVDYKLAVRPELVARWESALEAARRGGFEVVRLEDVPERQRIRDFTAVWADTFRAHWGFTAFTEDEIAELLGEMAEGGILETSVLAYREGEAVGFLFDPPDDPTQAITAPGREVAPEERLNLLGIGVRESARGRGLNYAMAAFSYLELARRGWTHLSYTLVLDHNWPSRRTGEGLGGEICANYVAYRRDLRRR